MFIHNCDRMAFSISKKNEITKRNYQLVLMASLSIVYLFFFSYLPMAGTVLAFKDGNHSLNILKATIFSDWTLDNFKNLFSDQKFWSVMGNTVGLNVVSLMISFPAPIIFALLLNEIHSKKIRTVIQSIVIFPHFISWVIFGGIVGSLTDMSTGVVNPMLEWLGLSSPSNPVDLNLPQYFWGKMIIVSLIKNVGWGSVIYTAGIAGINPELYEAADVDGAGRFVKATRLTLPMLAPTITIFLLLSIARLLGNSFEQFFVFQNVANLSKSEVLATYVYSTGFTYRNYSSAAAMSLFDGMISLVLLLTGNGISKRLTGRGFFQ